MTPEQKLALIEYSVRGSSTKAILEDDDTGLFNGVSRGEVEEALDEFADILTGAVNEQALFDQEEIDAGGRTPERIEFLKDIIITAYEGGIGYWALGRNYDPDNGTVDLVEDEHFPFDDNTPWQTVNLDTIERGLAKVKDPSFKINKEMRGWITTGDITNDAGDIDSGCADAIVQAALFGELVYG